MWIFEDRDANIWFGTGKGVSRYDGKSMTNFTTKEGLVHNSVYTIAEDASGRIWFGTQGGVCSYDGKSFSNLADQVGRSFVNIRAMVVDRSGNLWFGGQEGAFRYDGKTVTTFTSKEGLLDDFVGSMIVDRAGNVWLGHPGKFPDGQGGGATRYDGKSFKQFTQKDGLGEPHRLLHARRQGRKHLVRQRRCGSMPLRRQDLHQFLRHHPAFGTSPGQVKVMIVQNRETDRPRIETIAGPREVTVS